MIDSDAWFEREFATSRVMAILRGFGPEKSLELATRAWDAGVTSVELPIQTQADVDALRLVAAAGAERGMSVGAGTILRVEQVAVAAEAGAVYTVSPGLDDQVVRESLLQGLPTLPGVATASEVHRALGLGIGWLKAFPARELGPNWIRSMHGPFPAAVFVVTGGIDLDNARDFLAAGARVVSLGSALGDPTQVDGLKQLVADAAA